MLCQHCGYELAEGVVQIASDTHMIEIMLCGFCYWYYTMDDVADTVYYLEFDRAMCEPLTINAAYD